MYTEQAVWTIAQLPDLMTMVITDDLVMYRKNKTGINVNVYRKITCERKNGRQIRYSPPEGLMILTY